VARTSDEVKDLLRHVGSGLFAGSGYAGTSTRAVAAAAGVSETLLFKHFGSKAGLFEATTLANFQGSVDRFVSQWSSQPSTGDEDAHARAFLRSLLWFFRDHRGSILALVTVDGAQDDDIGDIQAMAIESFEKVMTVVQRVVLTRANGELYNGVDAEVTAPAVVGTLLSVTVLDGWLFHEGVCQPAFADLDHEVISYIMDGAGHRIATS